MKYYYSDPYGQYYTSNYSISKLPLNKPVWGFAYSINDDTEDKRLICLPVQGEIHENFMKIRIVINGVSIVSPLIKREQIQNVNLVWLILIPECMQTHMKKLLKCSTN